MKLLFAAIVAGLALEFGILGIDQQSAENAFPKRNRTPEQQSLRLDSIQREP